MKNVISLGDVLACNEFLAGLKLGFRVHLQDACGKQSCYLEPLGEEASYEKVHGALSEFFGQRGCRLSYSDDGLSFWPDGQ